MDRTRHTRPSGFTLVEMSAVLVIIGIITAFLLSVSFEGLRRSEDRATQSLIVKLEVAMADRLEVLTNREFPINETHRLWAMVPALTASGAPVPAPDPDNPSAFYPVMVASEPRARLIAQADYLRAVVPDVFFLQQSPSVGNQTGVVAPLGDYPINFNGAAFVPGGVPGLLPTGVASVPASSPFVPTALSNYVPWVVPVGNTYLLSNTYDARKKMFSGPTSAVRDPNHPAITNPAGLGVFGAYYSTRASINKQLGYAATGFDSSDNDSDGLIDEWDEGVNADPVTDPDTGGTTTRVDLVTRRLVNHRHETARAEMLYAVLVENQGPLGSAFSREDFSPREVGDTDNDGLLEFLDAWGSPIQFFRWPSSYASDVQKGSAPYGSLTETRQLNALDANNLLISPAWWGNPTTLGSGTAQQMSSRAIAFTSHFFSLVDPAADLSVAAYELWDRTGFLKRRANFSKFLILSPGPDKLLGVGLFDVDYDGSGSPVPMPPNTSVTVGAAGYATALPSPLTNCDQVARGITLIEGQARQVAPAYGSAIAPGSMNLYQANSTAPAAVGPILSAQSDDITNHNIRAPGTGVR